MHTQAKEVKPLLSMWVFVLALTMVTGFVYQSAQAAPLPRPGRALWFWNADVLFDEAKLEEFIEFARAPHGDPEHRIELVFMSVRGGFPPPMWASLRKVVGRLHEAGITVHALAGDPSWTLNHLTPLARLQQVLDYNEEAAPNERIPGIQFDIEPYLLRDQWNTPEGYERLRSGFLELLASLKERRDAHDPSLQIGVAIPRWYDQEQFDYFNEPIQELSDYVAIMNYWNETDRLIRDAAGELATGDRLGKDVYVGIEVQKIDPPSITFYGYTVKQMERVLEQAEAAFMAHPSYRGIVIHHYAPYVEME